MDGKHISIRNPKNGGSLYYNYKGYYSLIMLTLVDADYKFLWIDVGANGTTSDCFVFNQSRLKTALENDELGFRELEPLPADERDMWYFIIRDNAFPLQTWMMKPFSCQNFEHDEHMSITDCPGLGA